MEITLGIIAFCSAAYFVAGFIDAIAGGGGLITIPSLMIAGLPPHCVLGTNKFSSSIGSGAALVSFWRNNLVNRRLVPMGFASAFLGGVIGSWLAMLVEKALLGKILLVLLPMALVISLFAGHDMEGDAPLPEKGFLGKLGLVGVCIGMYDGFFGPATGSFFIIALHLVLGMGLVKASANTKVMNMASNLGGLATFAAGGVVIYALAIPCAIASVCGNLLGAHLAVRIGARAVRLFLYVAMSLLMATLVWRFCLS